MAASDARKPLSIPTTNQISKDMQGPDNPIPLSPQWLLPKPGENKAGIAQGENHLSACTAYGDHSDVNKSSGIGEEMNESQKKKDVFRPTFLDMESGRRDRWRDEERDTNPSIRKDRWREGDKDISDSRRTDRWVDNSSMRHFGEALRAPTDRWADSSKDNNPDQRRESKWNTRWGPDDRDMDKWSDAGKHGEMPHDKGLSHLANHGMDEREGDHYRPWRPNSLQSRGRAEPPHHQTHMAGKEGPTFGHGRGRGDNTPSTFVTGRGRSSFGAGSLNNTPAHSQSVGFIPNRGDKSHGEPSPFRYNRTKLLDVYRLTDVRSSSKLLEGLLQVSSLTQEEPLEPLALCAPTHEELGILKGIDKGEIVSSGAPPVSKDGSAVRSTVDYPTSRRAKIGSRDDVSLSPLDDASDKAENTKVAHSKLFAVSSHDKQAYSYGSNSLEDNHMYAENKYGVEAAVDDSSALKNAADISNNMDSNTKVSVPAQSGTPWRSPSVGEHARPPSRDWFDVPSDIQARSSGAGWSQGLDRLNGWENGLPDPSYAQNERKLQMGEDSAVRKHPPMVVDREHEPRKLLQPAPEDLVLYYKDPQGQVQGPFSGSDIIGWFEAGYFGINLQVRLANAPNDSPFFLLGDVMPHLRKAGPPPGFKTAKQNEGSEVSSRSSLSGFGKVLPGPCGLDLIGREQRHAYGSSTEAQNRFLESLMSGDICNSPLERFTSTEGLQGFIGNTSSGMPPLGAEGGDALNLLAKRLNLERQKSLPHPYPYWPARDAAPVVPSPDILRDSSMPQANLLSTTPDVPRPPPPQTVEMMSILQGSSDRSSAGVTNGIGGWPDFSGQGGVDPFKDTHGQNIAQAVYGMQQHKMQPQNQPSMTNLLAQTLDSPSILTDKLLSSGLVQDPQVLNLLQQQYLLQLQSQQSMPSPQLLLLDKILLLKQQQKQEEQQQLLRQQQQLLSQVLSEQHLQRLDDHSFGQLQPAAMPAGNVPTDHSLPQLSHQLFQASSQVPVSGIPDDRNANFANMPPKVSHDLSHTVASEGPSLHLPHQRFEVQKSRSTMPANSDHIKFSDSSPGSVMVENLAASEAFEKCNSDFALQHSSSELSAPPSIHQALQNNSKTSEPAYASIHEISTDPIPSKLPGSSVCKPSSGAREEEVLMPDGTNDVKAMSTGGFEGTPVKESSVELSAAKEAKNVEAREVKKTSDKKSRKLKSSKAQPSSEQVKGASKTSTLQQSKRSEAEGSDVADKSDVLLADGLTSGGVSLQKNRDVSRPQGIHDDDLESESKVEQRQSDSVSQESAQVNNAHRAWKPAVCVKPKSLLEIQQEEQRRAHTEILSSGISASGSSMGLSTPWSGVAVHSEPKVSKGIYQDSGNSNSNMDTLELSKIKKSGLHDLLAQEVLAKSNERDIEVPDTLQPLPSMSTHLDKVDDDNFIEAKDTKKSRKKAAKAKGAGAKVSMSVSSADVIVASSPIEKGKTSKHVQAEKEILHAPPSGPSLGDFVPWKGESTSPSPAPAWSTDPVKLPKPTSLRDILKEQDKKVTSTQHHSQVSTPQKPQSAQTRAGSWSMSATSPSKATSPIQIHSHVSSQSKYKGEDDLFWGPPEHSKQDSKKVDFPQLGNHGSWATKSTPTKGAPSASISRQKSTSGRSVEHSFSSSPASAQLSTKGKRDGNTKHSEAMDFRDWCESESVRLTGSKDTSFLEFCVKQSRSEAEILLIENLGSFDPNHAFIEKFLDYMELLPADVLEIAFQSRNDLKAYKTSARDMTSDNAAFGDIDRDNGAGADSTAKGGKKKGKKGKKVSPAVLGFNVVSNRIMMGEIQTVED